MGIKIDGKERDGTAHADDDLELPKMDWLVSGCYVSGDS